ncbi:PAP2 superfamily protein [Pontibacter ummariensis]|uniref:PAP2 superfamily protein n=1 Tax=Pontibacter ummariensis TaxID=1610492 RepID=A0A239H9N4_9BACT|nr:phosphatase PAP2 family protein [Pontibacter ummariensis]PRY10688.1 PAP2 superfamily protein [Pontibacter ummariensis]SNS78136.1 PAP2 superfamily protein [Pontibacter ummariensis]
MKRVLLLWMVLIGTLPYAAWSQSAPSSPYEVNWLRDGAVIAGGVGATVVGSTFIKNKDRLTAADLAGISKQDVNGFDRFAAGNYSAKAETTSDFFFYGSFATPLLLLLDKDIQQSAPQVYLLYGQAMAMAGGLYALSAGLIDRKRPSVYAEDAPLEARLHKYATNSFYGGHVAATASATFFAAKVFHDFNPDSKARPYVWAAAAAIPATVGYLRLRAGKHFLSDNLIGYAIGTGIGILVPELHRKDNRLSVLPENTPLYDGVKVAYSF